MRIAATALAWGIAAAALPAHAADLATIDCVVTKIQPALTTQIEADITRNLSESGKRPSYDPVVGSGLRLAAMACGTENKWSEAAIAAARVYAIAKIGWPIAQRVVREKGFDAEELEDRFQQLSQETRDRPLTAEETQALVIASVTDEKLQTRENAELLNEFFAFQNTLQYAAFNFSHG